MSSTGDANPSPPGPSDAAATVGIANLERTFLRLTFWQTLLSLAGVFTGAVALYAALSESQAVREQTAASVWPYVQLIVDDTDDGARASFAVTLENVGVGPARMQGLALTLAADPLRSWDAAAQRLMAKEYKVGVDYGRSSVSRRVIAPGERITAFRTNNRELAVAMQRATASGDVQIRYCFCSIFDQCWLYMGADQAGGSGLQEVPACPDFGEASFRD